MKRRMLASMILVLALVAAVAWVTPRTFTAFVALHSGAGPDDLQP